MAIVGKLGTLGVGGDVVMPILDRANARVGANWFSAGRDFDRNGVGYDAKLDLASAGVMVDWFAIGESELRLTFGLIVNHNRLRLNSKQGTSGAYEWNGTTYPRSSVTEANEQWSIKPVAPYIGIGFGNPVAKDTNWSLNVDLGVMYTDTPSLRMNGTCSSGLTIPQCQQMQDDIKAEEARRKRDYRANRVYPVVSVGLGKRF